MARNNEQTPIEPHTEYSRRCRCVGCGSSVQATEELSGDRLCARCTEDS